MSLLKEIVPEQKKGWETGVSVKIVCKDIASAQKNFDQASERLLNVNQWPEISGALSASFQLTDDDGKVINDQRAAAGHFIRIRLPAPGNAAGDGYDWVRVERVTEENDTKNDQDICAIIVRPVANPAGKSDKTAHFYTSDASSTFLVIRIGTSLRAMELGRNEIANKKGGLWGRLRNIIVAFAAKLGLSKPQWKALMEGVLNGRRN